MSVLERAAAQLVCRCPKGGVVAPASLRAMQGRGWDGYGLCKGEASVELHLGRGRRSRVKKGALRQLLGMQVWSNGQATYVLRFPGKDKLRTVVSTSDAYNHPRFQLGKYEEKKEKTQEVAVKKKPKTKSPWER